LLLHKWCYEIDEREGDRGVYYQNYLVTEFSPKKKSFSTIQGKNNFSTYVTYGGEISFSRKYTPLERYTRRWKQWEKKEDS